MEDNIRIVNHIVHGPVIQSTLEYIEQRRRQLHVHSVIYYHLDAEPLITDATFDKWSEELVKLNLEHPDLIKQGDKWELFEDWTGTTGMHLPVNDRVVSLANHLLRYRERHNY